MEIPVIKLSNAHNLKSTNTRHAIISKSAMIDMNMLNVGMF